ncbi:hypothetical protein VKT23_000926 [Stygiomarasmius scandens]|uniref:Uncharacterized protein n=1 Tax=Marasmiellus scandens TaxID=2682957 RepID=A0ABR1K853_9AGAR
MAGANYMGGKRNAAKARTRDTAGRAQKRYFSRKRLDLAMTKSVLPRPRTILDIDLSHAKCNTEAFLTDPSFIPDTIHVSPCTPRSLIKLSQLREESDIPDNPSLKSKVLQTLDSSEPMSLRTAMNRVLALPDLAGLGLKRPILFRDSALVKAKKLRASQHWQQIPSIPTLSSRSHLSHHGGGNMNCPAEQDNMYDDTCISGESVVGNRFGELERPVSGTEPLLLPDQNGGFPGLLDPLESLLTTPKPAPNSPSVRLLLPFLSCDSQKRLPDCPLDNIFDYDDPWKALGTALRAEKMHDIPLQRRNFCALLKAIPDESVEIPLCEVAVQHQEQHFYHSGAVESYFAEEDLKLDDNDISDDAESDTISCRAYEGSKTDHEKPATFAFGQYFPRFSLSGTTTTPCDSGLPSSSKQSQYFPSQTSLRLGPLRPCRKVPAADSSLRIHISASQAEPLKDMHQSSSERELDFIDSDDLAGKLSVISGTTEAISHECSNSNRDSSDRFYAHENDADASIFTVRSARNPPRQISIAEINTHFPSKHTNTVSPTVIHSDNDRNLIPHEPNGGKGDSTCYGPNLFTDEDLDENE